MKLTEVCPYGNVIKVVDLAVNGILPFLTLLRIIPSSFSAEKQRKASR